MIKRLIVFIFFFVISTTPSLAIDTSLPIPSVLPDNPLYFFKSASNRIRTLFTTDSAAKAKLYKQLSEEKLAEANALLSKGNNTLAQQSLIEYQKLSNQATTLATSGQTPNSDDLISQLAEQTVKHEAILNQTKSKFPQFSSDSLDSAISNNHQEQLKAIENLSPDKVNSLKQKITTEKQNLPTQSKLINSNNTKPVDPERKALETFEKSLDKAAVQPTTTKPTATPTISNVENLSQELSDLEKELNESFEQLETEGLVQGVSTNNILDNLLQFLHIK